MTNGQQPAEKNGKEEQGYNYEKSKMDREGGNHGFSGEELNEEKEKLEEEIPDDDTTEAADEKPANE